MKHMSGAVRLFRGVLPSLLLVLIAVPALRAQEDDSLLQEAPPDFAILSNESHFGLEGYFRQGTWMPLKFIAQSWMNDARPVTCQWILSDIDGDEIVAERNFVLNKGAPQYRWLYAKPSVNLRSGEEWSLVLLDQETREVLATKTIQCPGFGASSKRLPPTSGAIGVLGSKNIGLPAYVTRDTQHEHIQLISFDGFGSFPDRWQGLSIMEELVWAPSKNGVNPITEPTNLSIEARNALKTWISRGHHMVIILPSTGEQWTSEQAGVRDILPPVDLAEIEDADILAQIPELGTPLNRGVTATMDYFTFVPRDPSVDVLLRDQSNRPVIVSHQYGFGRVTMVGVNLADGSISNSVAGLPNGPFIWSRINGWMSPAYDASIINAAKKGTLGTSLVVSDPDFRDNVELGSFINRYISMSGQAGPALLLFIFLFIGYWVAAGPISFAVLKARRQLKQSWFIFFCTVAIFSVVAWGGAYIFRPNKARIKHFSVVDMDSSTNEARVQSWFSLYVPRHGSVEVKLAPGLDEASRTNDNLLSASGVRQEQGQASFRDTRRYTFNGGNPAEMTIPYRSTAKQMELDYFGPIMEKSEWLNDTWVPPQADSNELRLQGGYPVGKLSHGLPGTLKDVVVIFSENQYEDYPKQQPNMPKSRPQPSIKFYLLPLTKGEWPAKTTVPLGVPKALDVRDLTKWALDYAPSKRDRNSLRVNEGRLGAFMASSRPSDYDSIIMLSFYNMLPAPNFGQKGFSMSGSEVNFQREAGRDLDISQWTRSPCVIIIGRLDESTMPAPLSVDGDLVSRSEGATIVRWRIPVIVPPKSTLPAEQPDSPLPGESTAANP